MSYGVFMQEIGENTNARNIELVGEIIEVEEFLEEGGASKSSCDGQTSATPPRYADDNMMLLYLDSEERANGISQIIREEIITQVSSGAVQPRSIPSWINKPTATGLTFIAADIALLPLIRDNYPLDTVSDSQLISASEAFLQEKGRVPTPEELLAWIALHRDWEEI